MPEIAFAGRSNAGKSTAINVLAGRTRLAFASRTPGRTQQINLFALRSGALVADLPGYGYAAVSKELKRDWQAFLWHYITTRPTLVVIGWTSLALTITVPILGAVLANLAG